MKQTRTRSPVTFFFIFIMVALFIGMFLEAQAQDHNANVTVDPDLFSALEYRSIGPYRGGRSTTGTGVAGQIFTFYMGTSGGGVWKTTDAGQSWDNISDGWIKAGSIGDIKVASSDSNVVYVAVELMDGIRNTSRQNNNTATQSAEYNSFPTHHSG